MIEAMRRGRIELAYFGPLSYVLAKVPGAMCFLGVAEEGADWKSCCSIHSSRMMVDESVLPRGTAFLAGCALDFLAEGWS